MIGMGFRAELISKEGWRVLCEQRDEQFLGSTGMPELNTEKHNKKHNKDDPLSLSARKSPVSWYKQELLAWGEENNGFDTLVKFSEQASHERRQLGEVWWIWVLQGDR